MVTLSSGTRFGPYEISDEIGAGGMGSTFGKVSKKDLVALISEKLRGEQGVT